MMDDITRTHIRVVGWVAMALAAYLLASWTADSLFGIHIPAQFILLAVAAPMAADVYLRIRFLCNHTGDENTAAQRRTVLIAIPAEALLAVLCVYSLFAE